MTLEETIEDAIKKGTEKGFQIKWYEISLNKANQIIKLAFPEHNSKLRPGWEISLPTSKRNGRLGYWIVENISNHHAEMYFYYL